MLMFALKTTRFSLSKIRLNLNCIIKGFKVMLDLRYGHIFRLLVNYYYFYFYFFLWAKSSNLSRNT